jgi:hypothetical protein
MTWVWRRDTPALDGNHLQGGRARAALRERIFGEQGSRQTARAAAARLLWHVNVTAGF